MKRLRHLSLIIVAAMLAACADEEAAADKAQEKAEANARADAARKEMERLPETFKPRYNRKLNQSDTKPGEAAQETPPPASTAP